MWVCARCGEEQEDVQDMCWSCFLPRKEDGRVATAQRRPATVASQRDAVVPSSIPDVMIRRYRDAYRVARATVGVGDVVKLVAVVVGVCMVLTGFVVSSSLGQSSLPIVWGIGAAVVVGLPVFILGILISASGQMHQATLDGAVNSSPFLSDAQRLQAMRLAKH